MQNYIIRTNYNRFFSSSGLQPREEERVNTTTTTFTTTNGRIVLDSSSPLSSSSSSKIYETLFIKWCYHIKNNDPTIRTFCPHATYAIWELLNRNVKNEVQLLIDALLYNTMIEDVSICPVLYKHLRLDKKNIIGDKSDNIIDIESLFKLKKFLSRNEQLSTLRIMIYSSDRHEDVENPLFQGLSCSRLNELYLKICDDDDVNNDHNNNNVSESSHINNRFFPLSNFIAKSLTLKMLSIEFSNQHLSTWDMQVIASGIEANQSLRHLKFNNLKSKSRNLFFNVALKHPNISSIDLINCDDVGDGGITRGIEQLCSALQLKEVVSNNNNNWKKKIKKIRTPFESIQIELLSYRRKEIKAMHIDNFASLLKNAQIQSSSSSSICKTLCWKANYSSDIQEHDMKISFNSGELGLDSRSGIVSLIGNILTTDEAAVIAEMFLRNDSIEHLSLHTNILEDIAFVTSWKKFLIANKTLQQFEFSFYEPIICYNALKLLFEGFVNNTSLRHVAINGLKHRFRSMIYGSNVIGPTTTTPIRDQNEISKHVGVCKAVSDVILNTRLVQLKISHLALLQDSDWVELADALQHNTILKRLELNDVGLGNKTMHALASALTKNSTLQVLNVSENSNVTSTGVRSFCNNVNKMSGLIEFWPYEYYDESDDDSYKQKLESVKLITSNLTNNYTLREISFIEKLNSKERFYLDLNQYGRRFIYNDDKISQGLWPTILSHMTNPSNLHLLYFFLREKADLLASVGNDNNNHNHDHLSSVMMIQEQQSGTSQLLPPSPVHNKFNPRKRKR